MKRWMILMLVILLMAGLTGCGGDSASDGAGGRTLVYGSGDYTAINPVLFEHGEINSLIFLGLTTHDEANQVVAAAAERWDYDPETLTYRFTLREGLSFHDGHPLTAEDVKFTLEAILDPANGSEIVSNFEEIESISVIDELTVEIRLSAPNVALPDYLTVGILPRHLLQGEDLTACEFNQNPVGAGPYRLVSWDLGQSIVLEEFDDFYLGAPKIGTIVFKIVADSNARAMQLLSGDLDFAQITPKDIALFEGKQGFRVYDMKTADYRGILYNRNSDFFSRHPELPNILSHLIDKEAIVDTVLLGYGYAAYSPLQAGAFNDPAMAESSRYDPALAKQMLAEAGWVMGPDGYYAKDGERLAFVINNGQQDQVRIDMSNVCAQYLQNFGVDGVVKINLKTDWAKQDAYLIGWGSPFDPDDHTYKVFGTEKGANYAGYSNPAVDDLLLRARELSDAEERLPYYIAFQQELAKDLPFTFLAYLDAIYAGTDRISGMTENTVLGHHGVGIFWNIYDWDLVQ